MVLFLVHLYPLSTIVPFYFNFFQSEIFSFKIFLFKKVACFIQLKQFPFDLYPFHLPHLFLDFLESTIKQLNTTVYYKYSL